LFIVISAFASNVNAQQVINVDSALTAMEDTKSDTIVYNTDSLEARYQMRLFPDMEELADSVFSSLHDRKFEELKQYLVTTAILQDEFDTLDLKALNRLAQVKSEYVEHNLRKQFIKMQKEAKSSRINFRVMEALDRRIKYQTHGDGHEMAQVMYYCDSRKHKFYLSFVAVKIMGHWFLSDELLVTPR